MAKILWIHDHHTHVCVFQTQLQSSSPFAVIITSTFLGSLPTTAYGDVCSFGHKNISDVRHTVPSWRCSCSVGLRSGLSERPPNSFTPNYLTTHAFTEFAVCTSKLLSCNMFGPLTSRCWEWLCYSMQRHLKLLCASSFGERPFPGLMVKSPQFLWPYSLLTGAKICVLFQHASTHIRSPYDH